MLCHTPQKTTILLFFLIILLLTLPIGNACKDIIAVNTATAGNYNLLLKVRDPSRPGLQILSIIPEGYQYTYHHPWKGTSQNYIVQQKFIAVTTQGDTIPNIIKPGMALTSAGLAFGDADSNSNWKNPTKHAWDDFDWIRYTCQQATTEDEAVNLMTTEVVKNMHASGVSENLFIIGPKKGYLIEADAFQYKTIPINDVIVRSNYPKALWTTQWHKKLPITLKFTAEKTRTVRPLQTIRLNSLFGIRITKITSDSITAHQVPRLKIANRFIQFIGTKVTIPLGERRIVGDYSVKLLEINGRKATIHLTYKYNAWEQVLMQHIQPHIGQITLHNMINWSRLHENDLENLRPMCEDQFPYENTVIYKIPTTHYTMISSGWYVPNHACSSLYIPIHIADTDIHTDYKNTNAAQLTLNLLETYGHNTLTPYLKQTEQVFLKENNWNEQIAIWLINQNQPETVSQFLTISDITIQQQAMYIQHLLYEIAQNSDTTTLLEQINNTIHSNYTTTLHNIANLTSTLQKHTNNQNIIKKLTSFALSICQLRIQQATLLKLNTTQYLQTPNDIEELFTKKNYHQGFQLLQETYNQTTAQINHHIFSYPFKEPTSQTKKTNNQPLSQLDLLLIFILLMVIFYLLKKRQQ